MNLIGEHLDYNGGLCLPMALPHATYAAVAGRDDDVLTVTSRQQDDPFEAPLNELGPGAVTGWASYAAGVVWALQEAGWRVPGMDVMVDGRVPLGAGLSSSAAIECAVALGAARLADVDVDDDGARGAGACLHAGRAGGGRSTDRWLGPDHRAVRARRRRAARSTAGLVAAARAVGPGIGGT